MIYICWLLLCIFIWLLIWPMTVKDIKLSTFDYSCLRYILRIRRIWSHMIITSTQMPSILRILSSSTLRIFSLVKDILGTTGVNTCFVTCYVWWMTAKSRKINQGLEWQERFWTHMWISNIWMEKGMASVLGKDGIGMNSLTLIANITSLTSNS